MAGSTADETYIDSKIATAVNYIFWQKRRAAAQYEMRRP
jgi:hypothetical protein